MELLDQRGGRVTPVVLEHLVRWVLLECLEREDAQVPVEPQV